MGRWFDVYAFRIGQPEERRVALLFTDVTAALAAAREREELLQALEVERSRLEDVFRQAPAFLAVLRGPENVFELVNGAYYQIVGHREILGKPLFDALPETRGQGFDGYLGQVRETGEPLVFRDLPVQLARTPGAPLEERFIDITYLPLREADGSHDAVIAHGTDVTEQVHARREAARLLAVSERVRAAAVAAHLELEAANQQLADQALELELSNQQLQEQAVELEMQAEALQATAADLGASEARLRDVFEQAPVAVAVLTGPEHVYTVMSPRYAEYTTTGRAGLGRPFREAVPEIAGQGLIELMDRVYRTGEPVFAQERLVKLDRDRDGVPEDYYFDVGYQPLRDAGGRVYGIASVSREVTGEVAARREAEAARADAERARTAAEQANRAKAEFLATMSHELRTPLNAIGGYAELLELGLRGPVTELQRADLARIQQSQRHLLGLVNEVLDLARVDSGELRVERATVRAGATVDAALALVRPQAAAKALVLSEACGGAADRPYLGDEPRVRQVLVNLLANAVKFTAPGGRVSVTCALTDAPPAEAALAPDAPYVALRVEDTGVGIAPDQFARIFEPFTQAEGGLTRPRGGTGLGLAISRRLARLMGGDLTVESRPGAGSAFTLWLPTAERRAHPRPPAATSGPERRTPPSTSAVEAPGLARIGEALLTEAGAMVKAWVARLRADADIPDAAAWSDTELEDHAATFLTDVALALRTMGQPGGEPAALLRDGTAIMALISERHGAQRARLEWPEAAIGREFALLREVLDAAVRRVAGADDGAACTRALAVVASLVEQAIRLSVGGYRLAASATG